MNADAGYGGLRAKRCLPAEFHRRLPTTDYLKHTSNLLLCESRTRFCSLGIPKSRQP
jgi:hypothetical protein